jgi:hypothetical protein
MLIVLLSSLGDNKLTEIFPGIKYFYGKYLIGLFILVPNKRYYLCEAFGA